MENEEGRDQNPSNPEQGEPDRQGNPGQQDPGQGQPGNDDPEKIAPGQDSPDLPPNPDEDEDEDDFPGEGGQEPKPID